MPGLLIDRKVLVKHKLHKLLNLSRTPPKTSDNIGIILLIPLKQYNNLIKLPNGDEKLKYISSKSFINSIQDSYFVIYNKNRKICEIRGDIVKPHHLNDVLKSITVYMPTDITVWAGIVPIENSDNYIRAGFDNPHIVDHSPLKHRFKSSGIAFSKENSDKPVSETSVRNKLIHASTQTGNICNIYTRFTNKAVTYMQCVNNGKGKEQSGSLIISNVKKQGNKLVFELSPDPTKLKTGKNEEVDAVWSRYNFHTHPKKAYENHGVTRGWPSSQDYVGFLQLNNHTIFHTVVTLEGVYIISLSPKWDGNINKIDKKIILNDYYIDHKNKISFQEYVNIINAKTYKGKQLFVVKFLSWENTGKVFPVFYSKTNNKCLVTDRNFEIYKLIND